MQNGIVQDTIEKLGEMAKDAGKSVMAEPAKIIEQILGDGPAVDSEEEKGSSGSAPAQTQAQDPLTIKKKQADSEKVQKLLSLHRERLREAEAHHEKSEQEETQKEMMEENEEEEKKQNEIVQLRKQDAKDAVLNAPTAAANNGAGPLSAAKKKMGSKELGRQKD